MGNAPVAVVADGRRSGAPVGALAERVLDGALRAFGEHGVRSCTIDEIARQAGVSRITVYRHVGAKDEVFRQVVLRNSRSYFPALELDFAGAASLTDVVRAVFTRAQEHYRSNRLYQTLLRVEPEALLRLQTVETAGFYEQAVPFLAPHLASFLAADTVADEAAEWVVRVAISVVASAGYRIDAYDPAGLERLVGVAVDGLR